MSLVTTIPETDATVPPPVRESGNGTLPASWLRSFDGTTRTDYKMFAPVAYAMQALILAAMLDGIFLTTTGRYRIYSRQEALFLERFTKAPFDPSVHRTSPSIVQRIWRSVVWFLRKDMAMAATPGTSNHGWGIADDLCEAPDFPGGRLISLRPAALQWLKDHAHEFGFALDIHEEPWHWHWFRPWHLVCVLTQRTVDVLFAAGILVPDLSTFGFTAPAPTNPDTPDWEDELMALTPEQRATLITDIGGEVERRLRVKGVGSIQDDLAIRTAQRISGAGNYAISGVKNLTGVLKDVLAAVKG